MDGCREIRCAARGLVGAVLTLSICAGEAAGQAAESAAAPGPCPDRVAYRPEREDAGSGTGGSGFRGRLFPDGDVFRSLLADMMEPRFYGSLRRVDFGEPPLPTGGDEEITAGLVALGERLDVWGLRDEGSCEGLQLGIFGSVFSQFNMDAASSDLLNTDFTAGLRVTGRAGPWSARLRFFHQSSHLGDELLLNNPGVERENLSFETVDALLSVDGRVKEAVLWRLYGGAGYIVRSSSAHDRGVAQWGAELRGPMWNAGDDTLLRLLAAGDFRSFEDREWGTTASVKAGLEWASRRTTRRIRILLAYLDGFVPFGQFFSTTQLTSWGIEFQVNL